MKGCAHVRVNDAALYCNDSNDHQSTGAHLEESDHRVKR